MDHYERLAVARDAGARQIARAFRSAARQVHPDAGGSADDFAAVAEAYRVLSDPALRDEYDRELDGEDGDWDEVAWGTAVGGDAPAGAASGSPVGGDEDEPWGDVDPQDGVDPAGGGAGPYDPWRLDPFVGAPRRIPDPLVPRAAPAVPPCPPGVVETLAAVVTWGLSLAVAVLQILAASSPSVVTAVGATPPTDGLSSVMGWGIFACLAIVLHAVSASRSSGVRSAWALTVLAWGVSFALLDGASSPGGLRVASVIAAACATAVGVAWARTFQRRRSHPDRLAALAQMDSRWLLDRHHRAVEWNRVRTALLKPGTTVVVVGAPATDLRGVLVPGRRWTFEPRTGTQSVRVVPGEVPWGSWLALDDEDRVVATAPAGAPEAWLSALRAGAPQPAGRRAT